MKLNSLGRCHIMVGEVGLGCEGLIGKGGEYVHAALDMMEEAGANAIDLYSPNPEMRSDLGSALKGRREKFVLQGHICTIWKNGQYKRTRHMAEVRAGLEDQLKRLGTDYLDIGMIHYVDAEKDWQEIAEGPVLAYARELREKNVFKALGLSSHNPQAALKAIETGLFDVLLFSINPCYDLQPAGEDVEQLWNREKYKGNLINMDPDRALLYETCAAAGVGITVMKAFGGGDLLKADQSVAGVAMTVDQCLAYALDRPAAACVFAGARSLEELRLSLKFGEASAKDRDYAAILAEFPKISWKGHCMYCGHCAPCVAGIDIAHLTKLLNLARTQKTVPETVREHYMAMAHKAGECKKCGECEKRCPFDVPIRQNMDTALEIFGA